MDMELCPLCGAELGGPYQMQGTKDVRSFEIAYVLCTNFIAALLSGLTLVCVCNLRHLRLLA